MSTIAEDRNSAVGGKSPQQIAIVRLEYEIIGGHLTFNGEKLEDIIDAHGRKNTPESSRLAPEVIKQMLNMQEAFATNLNVQEVYQSSPDHLYRYSRKGNKVVLESIEIPAPLQAEILGRIGASVAAAPEGKDFAFYPLIRAVSDRKMDFAQIPIILGELTGKHFTIDLSGFNFSAAENAKMPAEEMKQIPARPYNLINQNSFASLNRWTEKPLQLSRQNYQILPAVEFKPLGAENRKTNPQVEVKLNESRYLRQKALAEDFEGSKSEKLKRDMGISLISTKRVSSEKPLEVKRSILQAQNTKETLKGRGSKLSEAEESRSLGKLFKQARKDSAIANETPARYMPSNDANKIVHTEKRLLGGRVVLRDVYKLEEPRKTFNNTAALFGRESVYFLPVKQTEGAVKAEVKIPSSLTSPYSGATGIAGQINNANTVSFFSSKSPRIDAQEPLNNKPYPAVKEKAVFFRKAANSSKASSLLRKIAATAIPARVMKAAAKLKSAINMAVVLLESKLISISRRVIKSIAMLAKAAASNAGHVFSKTTPQHLGKIKKIILKFYKHLKSKFFVFSGRKDTARKQKVLRRPRKSSRIFLARRREMQWQRKIRHRKFLKKLKKAEILRRQAMQDQELTWQLMREREKAKKKARNKNQIKRSEIG